jgi:hypothetical protein
MAALALFSSVRIRTRSTLASWKAAAEPLRTHEEIITNMGACFPLDGLTWYKPGLFVGESGVPGPSATMAKSWWFPRVKNVIGGVSLRAAIRSPRTSV